MININDNTLKFLIVIFLLMAIIPQVIESLAFGFYLILSYMSIGVVLGIAIIWFSFWFNGLD